MAKLNYTAAKGLFESEDPNTTGAFSVSDVPVINEAVAAGNSSIQYIRIYDQSGSDGDDYAGLDELTFTISDGSTETVFEIDNDGDSATANVTAIDLSSLTLGSSTPTQVATLILNEINTVYDNGGEGTLLAIAQSEVDADTTADSGDYVDIYIYNGGTSNFSLRSSSASVLPTGYVQRASAPSFDSGIYLAASRADDRADVQTAVGGFAAGALADGTRAGQMVCVFNNATNRSLVVSSTDDNFSGGTGSLTVAATQGSILVWNGSQWVEWKYYGGTGSFA
jgi:hypothetical protein